MASFFDTKIEFLKGVGPQKGTLLNKELAIFNYGGLIQHYPFRYEDKSKIYTIGELKKDMPYVQIKGQITNVKKEGHVRRPRLIATFQDDTGKVDLIWFQGVNWVLQKIKPGIEYLLFGKPGLFNNKLTFTHPEIELFSPVKEGESTLYPVYNTTELLRKKYLDSKAIAKLTRQLLIVSLNGKKIEETLPQYIVDHYGFFSREKALQHIHFPADIKHLERAKSRLKFDELFWVQLQLLLEKGKRKAALQGKVMTEIPSVTIFYNEQLPFDLTTAQKQVIKEIRKDMLSGKQMNRLLQGDVGSGKTIVGFICMLMAIDNGTQACMMAPTEILAEQHYQGLKPYADTMGISIALLTGSTKKKERKPLFENLQTGELDLIIGTHALIEDTVKFKELGLCIIDEQHRFGVAQRAKLWNKNSGNNYPHMLVMTATPIPRTLAMTVYGDLDVSVIDELPAGRKPIKTLHKYDSNRLAVFGFLKEEIAKGRQVYIVYPLIEESETLDYKDLMDGYESVCRAFPDQHISIVHGKMKAVDKEYEMSRFVKGETHIMVATTVIEVGVNVPNASVMVIENAERFGLAQLHQLRGRVGRGAEQSYCLLMSDYKLSKEAKLRIDTMVRTNNGFEIADVDLKLRGPGDLSGTQQSGVLDLLIADLATDGRILQEARLCAEKIIDADSKLELPENRNLRKHISSLKKSYVNWGRIS